MKYNFKLNDFEPYIPPKLSDIKKAKTEVHYLGYYLKHDPQECFYYASVVIFCKFSIFEDVWAEGSSLFFLLKLTRSIGFSPLVRGDLAFTRS